MALTVPQSSGYYTATISSAFETIDQVAKSASIGELSSSVAAYVSFLRMKELNGQERAALSAVFAADKFSTDGLVAFNRLLAGQDACLKVFEAFASAEQLAFSREKVSGTPVEEVNRFRSLALARAENGGFGVERRRRRECRPVKSPAVSYPRRCHVRGMKP